MCTVVNKYKVNMNDSDVVYIGRGSVWGNPFVMQDREDRYRVIKSYRLYLWNKIMAGEITKEMLIALDGKRLACYCAPQACHGDILVAAVKWVKEKHNEH